MLIINEIEKIFRSKFGAAPDVFCSPGRINMIGEHTDYNNGLVLPAAIDKYILLGITKRQDKEIHIYSLDYQEMYVSSLKKLEPSGKLWPDYILGVIDEVQKSGKELEGLNIMFGGDIPLGAGLSSSAAIECATAFALNTIFDLGFSPLELAKIGQSAENKFVGVKCGIMDQFASIFGKAKNLIKLDCENFNYSYIPFNTKEYGIVLFDTQVKHSLASSAYNERRSECEHGVELVHKHHPEVKSLRDVTHDMLNDYVKEVDEVVYRRCNFIVNEIERLEDACNDLLANDFIQFGKRMFETHEGLQNEYEVSCLELDFLVDFVKAHSDVIGARMMGGGFGGCTINLIRTEAIDEIVSQVSDAYKRQMGIELKIYRVSIEDGTRMIKGKL